MRKKIIIIFSVFAILLTFSLLPIFGQESKAEAFFEATVSAIKKDYSIDIPFDSAESSVVIDLNSGNVLYSKNAYSKRGMASTTKIMTALVAIENSNLDAEFLIPKEAVGIEGSSVYLVENEPLTMTELLYCLLLESGNDAATAIAICCSGSEEEFVALMNDRAQELGLENTHFSNPHGLSNGEHYTTAYELAVITAEAMKYPVFREIVRTKTKKVRYDGVENGRVLTNHNKLLFGFEGATGVKTGYTLLDGKCLVSSAERNGVELICVSLHDNSPTANHVRLLNAVFDAFEKVKIADIGEISAEIPVEGMENEFLTVENRQEISIVLPRGAAVTAELSLPRSVKAPIEEGEIIGTAKCFYKDEEVYIIHLEATEEIKEPKKKNFWEKIFGD